MGETTREAISYSAAGLRVFGMVHRPKAEATERRPAVAIFHGFVGSKDQPHRIFVHLAEALARIGVVALRIDFPGRGDSEGETVDITVEADMAAALGAVDFLLAQPDVDPNRVSLLGLSWGGAIAACQAGRDERVNGVALLSCVPEKQDWRPRLKEIDGRQVAEMWGNIVGAQFYPGLATIDPHAAMIQSHGSILLVYGSDDDITPAAKVQSFREDMLALGRSVEVVEIANADHAFMTYAAERQAIAATVAWFEDNLVARNS